MREILFKAKRIDNGEWVEGFYVNYRNVIHYILVREEGIFVWREVDKNTICQYTGLTDKNGNKIWENDVVFYKEIYAIGKVVFMEDTFVFFDKYDGKQYINGMWDKFEVIGNIFDNPEFLEGEQP